MVCERIEIALEVVFVGDGLAGACGELLPARGIFEELLDGRSERGDVAGGDEQAVFAVVNQLWNAGDEGGDAGNAERHRFHESDGQSLGEAGEDEEIGAREAGKSGGVIERAGPLDESVEAEGVSQRSKFVAVRTIPDENQANMVA